jgi:serine O-acetyltransferase
MFTHFREDWSCYKNAYMAPGFWILQFHRFGMWARGQRSAILRIPLTVIHVFLVRLSEILWGISIGVNAKVGRRCVIEHFGGIVIHSGAVIGDDVRIQHGVTIGNKLPTRPLDAPVLGDRIYIGAGAKVLGRIRIGNDVSIGANAVVIADVPSNSTAVGVPARIIKRNAREPTTATIEQRPDGILL